MYRLDILGRIQLLDPESTPVLSVLSHPKRVALLALLAIEDDHRLGRNQVAALLWPDADQERGRSSVRTALYGIRRSLGKNAVRSVGGDVVLDTDRVAVDLVHLEEALAGARVLDALGLYGGPILDGFEYASMDGLRRVIEQADATLERRLLEAGRRRVRELLDSGRPEEALPVVRRLAEIRPLAEQIFRLHVRTLVAAGDRSAALLLARDFRAALRERLDLTPSEETRELVAELTEDTPGRAAGSTGGRRDGGSADGEDSVRSGDRATRRDDIVSAPVAAAPLRRSLVGGAVALLLALAGGTLWVVLTSDKEPAVSVVAPVDDGVDALRAGRYEEAVERFRLAAGRDTTAALPRYRLALAAEWAGMTPLARSAARDALLRSDDLSERERRLLDALDAYLRRDLGRARRLYLDIVEHHPDSFDAWSQLAEIDFHWGPLLGVPTEESRASFQRVRELAPSSDQAVFHLLRLDARAGRSAAVRSVVDSLAREPRSPTQRAELEILGALHSERDPAEAYDPTSSEVANIVLRETLTMGSPDRVTALLEGIGPSASLTDQVWSAAARAFVEASLGRTETVAAELDAMARLVPERALELRAALHLVAGGGAEQSSELAWRLRPDPDAPAVGPALPHLAVPAIYDPRRALLRALLEIDARGPSTEEVVLESEAPAASDAVFLARYTETAEAWRLLQSGRAREALERLGPPEIIPHQVFPTLLDYPEAIRRWLRAEALRATGRTDEALRWYRTFPHVRGHDLPYVPRAVLRRAEIQEERGRTDRAVALYREVADRLAEADGPFAALRERAEDRARTLASRGAG